MRNLFRQYHQPFCFREMGPLHTLPFSSSFSRARVAWSAAAVGGNGAEAITRRKLTFLGEITFTKYLISSPAKERRARRRSFQPRREGNALAKTFIVPYRSRYGIPFVFVCRRAPAGKDVARFTDRELREMLTTDRSMHSL